MGLNNKKIYLHSNQHKQMISHDNQFKYISKNKKLYYDNGIKT